ncbi:hypothetical protein JMJ55_08990 [Belnapia sp. T6]|uniref:JmjC domain-containing protein n=1 Tax=Belnapia mucosa TaxID=2804532 RepID=A0ABS1V189_9PROT|nr:cupin domain-containing protein [Belnapia mucosa]MBL6455456.1 hypothetical protein [Belnapia mucosa]
MTLAATALGLAFPGLGLAEVLALREDTGWRHWPATAPDRFADLLSVPVLDALLATDLARAPRVSMADAGRAGGAGVPEAEFCLPDGRVDPLRLLARFDAGATLVVSQMQEAHAPLAGFCRGLERVFLHPVQANVYLTPPGAQGFRRHYDTHDVLVLQVEGEKAWRVWPGQPLPHPTRHTPWTGATEPEGEPATLTLRPGAALYLPRGTLHEARGGEAAASLHLTIGLLEPCWAEALRLLLDEMEATEPALRAPFPSWRLTEPEARPALLAGLRGQLAGLGGEAAFDQLSLALLDGLAAQRMPLPARGLLSPVPGPETRLRLTDRMLHHVAALPEGRAELRWAGGRMPFGPRELGWLERLAEGSSAAALGEDALPLCRTLAAAGLLEIL